MTTTTADTGTRHYSLYGFLPRALSVTWPVAVVLAIVSSACGSTRSDFDGRPPATLSSTITGTVKGPQGRDPDRRAVELVNIESGERLRVSTDPTGGFSFRVRPGKYRIVLTLRDGESLLREPGILDLHRSDAAVHADFVVGSVRVSRPRGPAYRTDDGLGSPIA